MGKQYNPINSTFIKTSGGSGTSNYNDLENKHSSIEVGKDRSNMGAYVTLIYAKNN